MAAAHAKPGNAPFVSTAGSAANIQTLRGLACLLVVAFHVVGPNPDAGLRLPDAHFLRVACDIVAMLRIPLFTFLSGYLFAMRPVIGGRYFHFMRRKTVRLYLPAVVVGLLFLITSNVAPGVNSRPEYIDALRLLVYPYAHFWFIQAIIVIFAVAGILEVLGLMSTPFRYAVIFAGAIAVQLTGWPETDLFSLRAAGNLLPFFIMGIGMQRYASLVQRDRGFDAIVIGTFAVTFTLQVAGTIGLYGAPLEPRTLPAVMLSASSLMILWRMVLVFKPLEFIGQFAFTIYLFHVFFTAGMRTAATGSGIESVTMLFLLGLIAGVAGPILVEKLVKLAPMPLSTCLLGFGEKRIGTPAHN